MPWSNWPINVGDDLHAYEKIIQLWKATREKMWAIGAFRWPRTNAVWDSGSSWSMTTSGDGTHVLTDTTKNWVLPTVGGGCTQTGTRWANYVNSCTPYIPSSYDIVFDHQDHEKVVRAQILANTATTLQLTSMAQFVTEGVISSLSELNGRTYHIVKRGGLWWHERWPQWPWANELWRGSVDSATTSSLTEIDDKFSNQNSWGPGLKVDWKPNQFSGKTLMVRGDGKLRRVTITSNTKDTLSFSTQTWTPAGSFTIIDSGVWREDKIADAVFRWYRGAMKNYWSHFPNDQLGSVPVAAASISWQTGSGVDCNANTVNALDIDLWSELEEECSEADRCYSPDLYKTIRQIQHTVLSLSTSFVEPKSYDGATAIPTMTPARLLKLSNINAGTSTLTGTRNTLGTGDDGDDVLEGAKFSVPTQYNGASIYWTVTAANGANISSGQTTASGGFVQIGDQHWKTYSGRTVVWSAGFTRHYPLEFRYLYPKTIFIPDVGIETGIGGVPSVTVYDPPIVADFCCDEDDPPPVDCCKDCFGVGESAGWVTRGKSDTYVVRDPTGVVVDGGAFQTGDVARYVGDNVGDPFAGVFDPVESGATRPGGRSPDTVYWDRFYRGQHKPTTQSVMDAARSGTATSGTTKSLTDTGKNWWSTWFGGDSMRTETGTATGGSSSTLVDTTKRPTESGGENPAACFWKLERQLGGLGYANFILEFDKVTVVDDVPITTTYKTPIVSVNPASGTITFQSVSGVVVAAGDAYRIYEPPELNRWKDRDVKLTFGDGSTATAVVTHSDKDTLWFASTLPQAVTDTTGYQIAEEPFGQVMKWNGTKWEKPTGDDPRGQPWKPDSRNNLPHKRKAFGLMHAGDYVTRETLNEVYACLNKLRWTRVGVGWRSRANLATEEKNQRACLSGFNNGNYPIPPADRGAYWSGTWSLIVPDLQYCYDTDGLNVTEVNEPPRAYVSAAKRDLFDNGNIVSAETLRRHAYPTATISKVLSCSFEAYSFAVKECSSTPANIHIISDCKFDSFGDGVVENAYKQLSSASSTGTGEYVSEVVVGSKVGNNAIRPVYEPPSPPDSAIWDACYDPTSPTCANDPAVTNPDYVYDVFGWAGYLITDTIGIAKWDVSGGMTYLD